MTEFVYGRHPVLEILRAGRREIHRILVAETAAARGTLQDILGAAETASIPVERIPRNAMDQRAENHQGVIAEVGPYPYADLQSIRNAENPSPALVLLLDVIQDPQNLGTLLRTAEAVGVDGVVLPRKGSAGVTPAVVSASAGACEHLRIARENLARSMKLLQADGFWVVGLENSLEAKSVQTLDVDLPLAVVVGGESEGMRRLVRESCDFLVRLPMRGRISSLNAAVAGSIALFAIWSGRGYPGAEPGAE